VLRVYECVLLSVLVWLFVLLQMFGTVCVMYLCMCGCIHMLDVCSVGWACKLFQ